MKPALAWCLFLLLILSGCGRGEPERWNVLLVVVDTLRADRMGVYGYSRPTTPNLEAFAKEGVVFTGARSQAGCTFPSVNSLLTSRIPASFLHPGRRNMGIPETMPSLPVLLKEQGYSTAAVSASAVVRNTPSHVNRIGGFGRGFDRFDESCLLKDARCVNDVALSFLDENENARHPWFLYLHYLEPHEPYQPPADHQRRIAPPSTRARRQGVSNWALRGSMLPVARRLYRGQTQYRINPQSLAHLADLYDEEIAYFDEQIEKLFDSLRERRLLDRTLIVLAADHGEELYEHEHFGHCRSIAYDTVLKTPLLLRLPDAAPELRGLRRDALTENLDIVPTILDYLGLPTEGRGFEGASLRPVIERNGKVRRVSFGMQGTVRTIQDGTYKLTYDIGSGATQLFDLRVDPGETIDLSRKRPEQARRLREPLLRWIESREGPLASGESRRQAEEAEKRLRAVGYLN
ncbi:MAG TPA: sulfatase [Thermoanaerobaculia bacterium]|nr:sulfatase [Thermoanaerobaculia bacterium]